VERAEITLHDAARDREVVLTVRMPAAEEARALPMVIFSHGAGGSGDAFVRLSVLLAERGFVVVHPWHSDSLELARRRGEPGIDSQRDLRQLIERVDVVDRLADIRFILSNTERIGAAVDRADVIDAARVGLAGHSAGAMTTQMAAGVTFFPVRGSGAPTRTPIRTPVDGISAFAVISGQGIGSDRGRYRRTEESWKACDRPMLVITGSRDEVSISPETPQSRRHPFEYAPADGRKYLAFIDGATHSAFQGPSSRPRMRAQDPANAAWIGEITAAMVAALMEAWVMDDAAAQSWLQSGAVREIPGGELEWRHK